MECEAWPCFSIWMISPTGCKFPTYLKTPSRSAKWMEDPCSVNSPRRILSFSKNRRAHVPPPDSDDRSPTGFGVSAEHGTKLSEVYGFVGSITTVVATGEFQLLHFLGFFAHRYFNSLQSSSCKTRLVSHIQILAQNFYRWILWDCLNSKLKGKMWCDDWMNHKTQIYQLRIIS